MQGRARVRRWRVRMLFRFWKESRIQRYGRKAFLKIKARIQEFRYLNLSLVIGGSGTAFQLYVRRSRSPAKPPQRLSHSPLAETLFYSVVGDREGVSSRTLMRPGTTSPMSCRNDAFDRSAGITTTLSQLKHSNVRALKSRPTRTSIGARQFGQK
jgi:hypothetical protein